MTKGKRYPCSRCGKLYKSNQLIRWLEEAGTLSDRFCAKCYNWILDHWEEGMDVSDIPTADSDV